MTPTLRGSCLCGTVQYQVDDAFDYALNCHCSNCRRATGAAFKPFAGIAASRLQVLAGADALMRWSRDGRSGDTDAHDARCRHCGSLLWSRLREGTWLRLTLGSLLDEPSIRPSAHLFVGSKAPWYTITDDLPQHAEFG